MGLRVLGGLIAGVVALQGVAYAADPPPARKPRGALPLAGEITNPDWLVRPTGEDISRFYPPLAMALGLAGRTALQCGVSALGMMENCQALSETPKGIGFAKAAISMSPLFRMRPQSLDGVPVAGATVRIGIHFVLPAHGGELPADPGPPPGDTAMALGRRLAATSQSPEQMRRSIDEAMARYENDEAMDALPALAAMRAAIMATLPARTDAMATVYARRFSEDELAQLVAFWESPIGRKWGAGDGVNRDALTAANQVFWFRTQEAAREIFCKTAECLPAREESLAASPPSGQGAKP